MLQSNGCVVFMNCSQTFYHEHFTKLSSLFVKHHFWYKFNKCTIFEIFNLTHLRLLCIIMFMIHKQFTNFHRLLMKVSELGGIFLESTIHAY